MRLRRAPVPGGTAVYDRAEEMPEPDDPFWITTAGHLGIITEEQEDELYDAWERGCPGVS